MHIDYDPIAEYLKTERILNIFFFEVDYCFPFCISQEKSRYIIPVHSKNDEGIDTKRMINTPGNIACCPDDCSYLHSAFIENNDFARFLAKRESIYLTVDKSLQSLQLEEVCSNHTSEGCRFKTFKSPICLSYACTDMEDYIFTSFGILYKTEDVRCHLEELLSGNLDLRTIRENRSSYYDAILKVRETKEEWPIVDGRPQSPFLQL